MKTLKLIFIILAVIAIAVLFGSWIFGILGWVFTFLGKGWYFLQDVFEFFGWQGGIL